MLTDCIDSTAQPLQPRSPLLTPLLAPLCQVHNGKMFVPVEIKTGMVRAAAALPTAASAGRYARVSLCV